MARKIAESGAFVALAMVLSYVETLIPINFGIPGMKLGLANLAVVTALYLLGASQALEISVVRIVLMAFIFGNLAAMAYSLTGGLLSFAAMALLYRRESLSPLGVSAVGGAMHNLGQLLAAAAAVENLQVFYYLPILLAAGTVTGVLLGIGAGRLLPALRRNRRESWKERETNS